MEDLESLYESIKTTVFDTVDTVKKAADKVGTAANVATSSAGKAYIRQFVDKSEWGNEMLNEEEFNSLKDLVSDRLGVGGKSFSYKHYDDTGGSKIGYKASLEDLTNPRTSLRFTLGKANIVRDGNDVYVADTYDFAGKGSALKDAPLFEKVDYLLDAYNSGKVSTYGMAHLVAEMFGAKEGDGIPVRIKVGSVEELGLSPEDIDQLEDLQSFNARVKDNRSKKEGVEQPAPKKSIDAVIDTGKAFKRFGVVGGDATLEALRKAAGDATISWDSQFIGSDGKTYTQGMRIPRGIKLRVVR